MDVLSRTEELLLLIVWRLQDDAYGLTIRQALEDLTGSHWSVGAVYTPLKRLARRGYLRSHDRAPTSVRGGRSKRCYRLSAKGVQALSDVRELTHAAWSGLRLPEMTAVTHP